MYNQIVILWYGIESTQKRSLTIFLENRNGNSLIFTAPWKKGTYRNPNPVT